MSAHCKHDWRKAFDRFLCLVCRRYGRPRAKDGKIVLSAPPRIPARERGAIGPDTVWPAASRWVDGKTHVGDLSYHDGNDK